MSEALHKSMKNGVLGNILTVQLFLRYNVQETTQVKECLSFPASYFGCCLHCCGCLITLICPLQSQSQACFSSHLLHLSCSSLSAGFCLAKYDIKPPWLKLTVTSVSISYCYCCVTAKLADWSSHSPVFLWLPSLWFY